MINPHTANLSPEAKEKLLRLRTDFPYFARHCLKTKLKTGGVGPLELNRAQLYLHEQIEDQLQRIGKVRKIILKGRQQGISTIVDGRMYWRTVFNEAVTAFILAHETKATQTLLGKIKLFHKKMPDQMRLNLLTGNKNELRFENESEYGVATAGNEETGRGGTNQLLHASEAAFYPDPDNTMAGLFQTVADMEGTEVYIESTANGAGWFKDQVEKALKGLGEYELVFIPWYWQEEYRKAVPEGWDFLEEELDLKEQYGLDDEQLYWRYTKIMEMGLSKFKQEYPFTVAEAFQSSGSKFFKAEAITAARKSKVRNADAPIVIGVDPAENKDRTVIGIRQGPAVLKLIKHKEMTPMRLAGIVVNLIEEWNPAKVFIDNGHGRAVVDRLHELGYKRIVQGVWFNAKPTEAIYSNKRTEMAYRYKQWLEDEEGEVSIPDDDDLESDMMAIPEAKENSRGLFALVAKDKIKEDYGGKSPDCFDAVMLTFAEKVSAAMMSERKPGRTANTKNGSVLSARRRVSRMRQSQAGPNW